jgi:hypothetical protein
VSRGIAPHQRLKDDSDDWRTSVGRDCLDFPAEHRPPEPRFIAVLGKTAKGLLGETSHGWGERIKSEPASR